LVLKCNPFHTKGMHGRLYEYSNVYCSYPSSPNCKGDQQQANGRLGEKGSFRKQL